MVRSFSAGDTPHPTVVWTLCFACTLCTLINGAKRKFMAKPINAILLQFMMGSINSLKKNRHSPVLFSLFYCSYNCVALAVLEVGNKVALDCLAVNDKGDGLCLVLAL